MQPLGFQPDFATRGVDHGPQPDNQEHLTAQ